LRIASAAEIAALTAHQPDPAAVQPPEPGSEAALTQPLPLPDAPAPRGFKLNLHPDWRKPHEHPAWASRPQQETWRTGVLLVWDQDLKRIIGLSASQALHLLADIHSCDQWPQEGIILGVPMTRIVLSQPDRPPEAILVDQIVLSPAETAALLNLLHDNEPALRKRAEAEEVDKRRCLGRVCAILLNAAAKQRAQLARGETNPDLPADQPAQSDSS